MLIVFILLIIVLVLFRPKQHIKYYAITLKGNKQRENNVRNLENILGQPVYRFPAVKGTSISNDTFEDIKRRTEKLYNKNELGCYLSHKQLIEEIRHDDIEYAVVFEDDAKVYPDTHEKIQKLIRTYPDFDILFIGDQNNEVKNHSKIVDDIYSVNPYEMIGGTASYIIRRDSTSKVLSAIKNIVAPIDLQYYKKIIQGDIDGFIVIPHLVDLEKLVSTLGHH